MPGGFSYGRRDIDGVAILDVDGRLVAGEACGALRNCFTEIAAGPKKNVVLNLKNMDFIDSSGLGTLVEAHTIMGRSGRGLALLNISQRSAQLLILTKLSTVFRIYDDEQSAVNSFFPDRAVRNFDILDFVRSHEKNG